MIVINKNWTLTVLNRSSLGKFHQGHMKLCRSGKKLVKKRNTMFYKVLVSVKEKGVGPE